MKRFEKLVIVLLVVSVSYVQAEPSKLLGRACKLSEGERACGGNANCFAISIATGRTGLGVCMCKTNAFRQPGTLPSNTRAALQVLLGSRFWTDCVPVLRIGDPCIRSRQIRQAGRPPTGRRPPTGDYYYSDDSIYSRTTTRRTTTKRPAIGNNNNNGNAFGRTTIATRTIRTTSNYDEDTIYGYGNSNSNSNGDSTGQLLPDEAQCGTSGLVECKPGRIPRGQTECVSRGQNSQGSNIALYGEPCKDSFCDSTRGLKCSQGNGDDAVCTCSIGTWVNGACDGIPSHGDRCNRDSDCAPQVGQRASSSFARMRCRQFDFEDGGDYIGNRCQCPVVETNGVILAGYVVPNAYTARPRSGFGVNDVASIPVRLNTTNEARAPLSYWCLNQASYSDVENGYLGACSIDINGAQGRNFFGCEEGLVCMYFPVSEDDNSTMGRCIPKDPNDPRWYGSGGKSNSNGNQAPRQTYNQPQPQQQANVQSTPVPIRAGATWLQDGGINYRILAFLTILPIFALLE